jgi:hypothetical protein
MIIQIVTKVYRTYKQRQASYNNKVRLCQTEITVNYCHDKKIINAVWNAI